MINKNNNFIKLEYPSAKDLNHLGNNNGISLDNIDNKQLKTEESNIEDTTKSVGKSRISIT